MQRRTALLATAAFFLAACGPSGPPPPPPWSPLGSFSFTTVAPDVGTVIGSITITDEGGLMGGIIEAEGGMVPPMPITEVEVGDRMLSIQADFGGGEILFMEMNFTTDDDYTGFWTVAGESGDISGSRIMM